MNRLTAQPAGVAVIVVLWLVTLVAAFVTAASLRARGDLVSAGALVAEAEARHAAHAAIAVAALTLFDSQAGAPAHAGRSVAVALDGRTVEVAIREECGKIDLNTGWAALITGLFAASASPRVAQAVLDWRDPDSRPRPGGAEDADYRAAGLPHGARDGPFESVEELMQVLGVDHPLYVEVAPHLTVDCLNAGVEPLAASVRVLEAIPNLAAGTLPAFLEEREAYLGGRAVTPPQPVGGEPYLESSSAVAFAITATVESPIRFRWEAVVVLAGDALRPYLVRAWRRPVGP